MISQTLARSPDIVAMVREAVALLPQLVDELEGTRITAAPIIGAPGRTPAALRCPAARPPRRLRPALRPAAGAVAEALVRAAMDPVLHDIFRKETAGHVDGGARLHRALRPGAAPYAVTEALHRACHTLSGIAKTAGARQGIKVAEPMEHYVRKLHDNGHGLPEEGLALLRDTVRSLENVVGTSTRTRASSPTTAG